MRSDPNVITLEAIQEAQGVPLRRARFPDAVEGQYRQSQEARYRFPRLIMFAVTFITFASTPLYVDVLFQPSPGSRELILGIMLVGCALASLIGLISSALNWTEPVQRPLHTFAVLSLWASTLLLHYLGMLGHLSFPPNIVPIAVLAVAVFGGYRVRRYLIGATVTLLLHAGLVYRFADTQLVVMHQFYESLFFWVIALAGAITADQLSRAVWLRRQELSLLARQDRMTGLLNSSTFHEQLDRLATALHREGVPLFVAILDLDHFKTINDRFGHAEGDRVIKEAARVIDTVMARRSLDLKGRIGGEEFAIAMRNVDGPVGERACEELRARLSELRYGTRERRDGVLTASIGGYAAVPRDPGMGTLYLQEADKRLYRAKREGRNRVIVEQATEPGGAGSRDMPHLEVALSRE